VIYSREKIPGRDGGYLSAGQVFQITCKKLFLQNKFKSGRKLRPPLSRRMAKKTYK
jgi:hypothetical protein